LVIETTTPERVTKMQNNCKSFRFVTVGQYFTFIDGFRWVKTSATHAKPFGGGQSKRMSKDTLCENVTW
jgi:hypothetical protein